jgi:hypothetical protein
MVGVFGAWFLMSLGIGRRSLYLYGLCGLWSMLMILGFLGLASDRDAASLATGSIMLVWALCYQLTVGTVCYSLVAEMSTRRLQIKTVALGRACYNIVAIICNVLTPYMLNPGQWNVSELSTDDVFIADTIVSGRTMQVSSGPAHAFCQSSTHISGFLSQVGGRLQSWICFSRGKCRQESLKARRLMCLKRRSKVVQWAKSRES